MPKIRLLIAAFYTPDECSNNSRKAAKDGIRHTGVETTNENYNARHELSTADIIPIRKKGSQQPITTAQATNTTNTLNRSQSDDPEAGD